MNTSYLKFLKVVVAIAYYGLAAILLLVVLALTFNYFVPQSSMSVQLDVPIRLGDAISFSGNDWKGTLTNVTHSSLAVSLTGSEPDQKLIWLYAGIALGSIVGLSLVLAIVYQIKQIVGSLGTSDVFSMANVVHIRLLGILLIAIEFVKPLAWGLMRHEVVATLKENNIGLASEQFAIELPVAGLLILGLAEVFRSGYQLKQESELTI